MSIGIGAYANLILEDEHTVIYEYGGYNLDEPAYRNENHICDGLITMAKKCFIEPEIHEKYKKMPSGRKKLVVKRIPKDIDYDNMIKRGLIKIENCSNCWKCSENELHIDLMALRLVNKILKEYQEIGDIPLRISYNK